MGSRKITYDLRLVRDLWPVLVDDTELDLALVNIAINARSAMLRGGALCIATSNMCADDAHAKSSAAGQVPLWRAKPGEVILAVDDDLSVRAAVVMLLMDLGYEVIEADDGKSALALLETAKVDLLFSDVVMPGGMSGIELADKARAERPDLRILLTSGFPGTPSGVDATQEITHRLLSKPYRKHDLAITVRDVLDGPVGG